MKTAIYIEDGRTQFVLTPETEIDKKVLDEMQSTNLKTYRGAFYGCMGGWTRMNPLYNDFGSEHQDESLIFVIDKEDSTPEANVQVNGQCPLDGCRFHTS